MEKKVDGFMAYLTNEPILVESKGFTPVTLSFADNGLPLTAETFTVMQETIENDRDKLKAFLQGRDPGWNDALTDPEGGAKLAVEKYGKDLKLDYADQLEQVNAQNEAGVTADTEGQRAVHPDRRVHQPRSSRRSAPSASRWRPRSCSTSACSRRSTPRTLTWSGPDASMATRGSSTCPVATGAATRTRRRAAGRDRDRHPGSEQDLHAGPHRRSPRCRRPTSARPRTRSCRCSARPAAASRRCCGSWPGLETPTDGTGADQRACRPRRSSAPHQLGHRLPGRRAAAVAHGGRATSGCRSRWPGSRPSRS